jgi:hypothetical protein
MIFAITRFIVAALVLGLLVEGAHAQAMGGGGSGTGGHRRNISCLYRDLCLCANLSSSRHISEV